MARKIIKAHVHFFDDENKRHSLAPGDELPKWAEKFVVNPAAYEVATASAPTVESTATKPLDALKKDELIALAKERGLPSAGKVDELRERLAAADVEQTGQDGGGPTDPADLDREALEALAGEEGITEFDADTSDAELVALIENARG